MHAPRSPRPPRLALATLAATLLVAPAAAAQNVAQGKNAVQSSTWSPPRGTAGDAVDGDTNGSFGAGSVAHTSFDANAWWYVDLGATYDIQSIRVWNRTDCCGSRLTNFFVAILADGATDIGNIATATVWRGDFDGTAGASELFSPGGVEGRYVKVQFDNRRDYLQLAEVEVVGSLVTGGPGTMTPEPGTVALLATGLVGLGGVGIRRRRR